MSGNSAGSLLRGAVRQHEMMLERVWKYRLGDQLDKVTENTSLRYSQSALGCLLKEAKERVADTQRLILLYAPTLEYHTKEEIIDASVEVLATRTQDIYDTIKFSYCDYCHGIQFTPLEEATREIDAMRESEQVWSGFDIRERVNRILIDREVLEATLQSARANSTAAQAETQSAEASRLAAKAAGTTAVWTRWAVVATAIAAAGTAVSAYYTMQSARATQRNSPTQVVDQHVPHLTPVAAPKSK